MNQYLTPEQVAEMLQVNKYTIYKWIQSGKIPSIKIGALRRIDKNDLEKFLNEQKNINKNQ